MKQNKSLYWLFVLGALVAAALGACQASEAPTPADVPPTPDALSTLIAMQQTATNVPTVTPLPTATFTPTVTPSATPTATVTPTATRTLTATPSPETTLTPTQIGTLDPGIDSAVSDTPDPSLTAFPTNTPRAAPETPGAVTATATPAAVAAAPFDETQTIQDHYWLVRPFPRDPSNTVHDFASRSYPYGSTGGGQFQTHHGVDIQNVLGTPILAVANGTVYYAGDDSERMFGPQTDFYGNLVVIEHDRPAPDGRPLYTLYGHMSRVDVEIGQHVEMRDVIGQVGSTGVALGSHLHLEVRIGDPTDYDSTYNPDLWIQPWRTYGTLAGRVLDHDGSRVFDVMITLQPEDGGVVRTAYSYADTEVNPDPYYGEHFTYADLPVGTYQVSVRVRGVLRFVDTVEIEDRQTSWITIRLS